MFNVYGVLLTTLFSVDGVESTVVEYHTVLHNLAYRGTFVLVSRFQNIHCTRCVGGNGACKEVTACAEAQFGRAERVFNSAVR